MSDFTDKEVGLAVAATAAMMSGRARRWLRRGVVYSVAGVIGAGETGVGAARRIIGSTEQTSSRPTSEPVAKRRSSRPKRRPPRPKATPQT
jgi:hypothetical protein